ncbi:S24/S26 family peptidase [Peloplasma aerotolerans]|uniref:S24/S26 family peptidase n=1 Tax=Peloplasma aerotolerans TaxID=3044389 RepID=A0AAW6U5W8_9MOLU|nr:S24/S26 family peptidase [Mariniplasma sp. M4Ah]MDI6453302.1 S24/S26 family peptidase [Mariniplasma sp. M4Ah]MDR4969217.1 S24/S26 family peptidase [Acholeplasmataceae bacterium]
MNTQTIKVDEMLPIIIESLNAKQKATFMVVGSSMHPFLKHKESKVTIQKKQTYHKYDIILFHYMSTVRLHRIVKIKGEHITVQGDNLRSKEFITKQDIIGYVTQFENKRKTTLCDSTLYKLKVILWLIIRPIGIRLIRK